jgi:hypothetical protein
MYVNLLDYSNEVEKIWNIRSNGRNGGVYSNEGMIGKRVTRRSKGQADWGRARQSGIMPLSCRYLKASKQHLHRYLSEFDFRHNARHITEGQRAALALRGVAGRLLTYQKPTNALTKGQRRLYGTLRFGAGEGARTPKAINRQQVPNLLRLPISPLPHT